MPSGASNGTLGRPASAVFMNSVQIGSAAWVPLRRQRLVVVVADPDDGEQLGREADEPGVAQVVGRAGLAGGVEREAAARAPAPVPSLMTLRIMLVTRNVVSARATALRRRRLRLRALARRPRCDRWP